ncbi:hypothetical protein REPUB_Repub05bG0179000 [Reevesia pubescens]
MATTKRDITLKLLIDKTSRKVMYAEAGKDFVDFLFGLLQIPLGSIMGLLQENGMSGSGSFGSVYESLINLDPNYLQPNLDKDSLLRPKIFSSSNFEMPPLLHNFASTKTELQNEYTRADHFCFGSANAQESPFGFSGSSSDIFASPSMFTPTPSKQVGYVKATQAYMVMDNLMVKPISTISSLTILKTFNIKDFDSLEEKTVRINLKKGLELVKATFESETVLTKLLKPQLLSMQRLIGKRPEAHVFKADLPGLKKEEVKVEVEEGRILQISGERSKEQEEKNKKWHRIERSSGKFLRMFRLPENAKMDQVKASMENSVLTVTVPKEEEKKPEVKSIEISS